MKSILYSCRILMNLEFSLLTYLLTYFVMQSPPWKANWFAASQEIPRISRNPKVHYRTHKRPPPVSILGQPNPVHIQTSHLLESHPNIIHSSTPRSPQWSPSLKMLIFQISWNPFGESRVLPYGRLTVTETDMSRPIVAFRNFANTPKTSFCIISMSIPYAILLIFLP